MPKIWKVSSVLVMSLGLGSCIPPPKKPGLKKVTNAVRPEPGGKGSDGHGNGDTPGGGVDPIVLKENLEKIFADDAAVNCAGAPTAGMSELRLLTQDEYQQTVKDVLQVSSDFRGTLPIEFKVLGFRNNADIAKVSDDHAKAFLETAIAIADEVKAKLPALAQCAETDGEACAQKVLAAVAPKLWRRPLEEAEKAELLKLYKEGLASSPSEGMTLLLSSLLLSPHFLYRSEIGKDGALSPYELASALSYFFWGTSPDERLQGLAASGKILEEATLLAEAERLLKDQRSRFSAVEFANAWLQNQAVRGASKDRMLFPGFTDEIKNLMYREAEDTFDFLIRQGTANFENLFLNDYSIGPQQLAEFYKGQAQADGGASKIKFPGTPRKGILGLGAILASHASSNETHPIKRGDFVLRNVFCHIPDPVPPGLNVQIPTPDPKATTRERFAKHSSSPACRGCHEAIDGIGFGMEDYDSIGMFRDKDNGKAVDDAGELIKIDGKNTKFKGTGELSALIAQSRRAKRCFVVQWFRLAHGRTEREADICTLREMGSRFEKENMTLGKLLVQIVTHPSYAKRGP